MENTGEFPETTSVEAESSLHTGLFPGIYFTDMKEDIQYNTDAFYKKKTFFINMYSV